MNEDASSLVNVARPVAASKVPLVNLERLVSSRYNVKSIVSVVPSSLLYVKVFPARESEVTVSEGVSALGTQFAPSQERMSPTIGATVVKSTSTIESKVVGIELPVSVNSETSDTDNLINVPPPLGSTKTSPAASIDNIELPICKEEPLRYKSLNLFVAEPRLIVSSPRGTKSPITVPCS